MSQNKARTPFDDPDNSGVDVPLSKTTQPLPAPGSVLGGLQSGVPTGNMANTPPPAYQGAPQPPAYAPPPAAPPPQAQAPYAPPQPPPYAPPAYAPPPQPTVAFPSAPRPVAPPPSAPSGPLSNPTTKLKVPVPTLIGLAVTGGVVLAIGVPALMRRAIPAAPMKTLPPPVAVVPPLPQKPMADDAANAVEQPQPPRRPLPKATFAPAGEPLQPDTEEPADAGSTSGDLPRAEDDNSPGIDSPGAEPDSPAASGSDAGPDGEPEASTPRRRPGTTGAQPARGASKPSLGAGYSITAPAGWRKTQSGRRAIWSGPGGAQLLVEVSDDVSSSPREDWEKLDRAFEKKYKGRYRLRNIRDVRLTDRPASVWEFELDSKSGATTRKIDIATHADGRGYAIMGSSSMESWSEVSPQFQEAINSFQLRSEKDSAADAPEQGF